MCGDLRFNVAAVATTKVAYVTARKKQPKGQGLAAIDGKDLLGYDDLVRASGLSRRTLENYVYKGYLPAPDRPGVWLASRADIRAWITGEGRPGQGHRSDLSDSA